MSYKEFVNEIKPELDKAIGFLKKELAKIRTSRATPSLVEDVLIEIFEQKSPLKRLAAISCPSSREILVQPWDKSYLEPILNAISRSGLQMNPIIDKESIRISFPPLSKEYREDLLRLVSEKKENAKQTIRRWREEAWGNIQQGYREGEVPEDDKYRGKDELQDLVNEYNEKIEKLAEGKKKEITE